MLFVLPDTGLRTYSKESYQNLTKLQLHYWMQQYNLKINFMKSLLSAWQSVLLFTLYILHKAIINEHWQKKQYVIWLFEILFSLFFQYDLQDRGKLSSAGQELQLQNPLSQAEKTLWGFPGLQPTRSNSMDGAAVWNVLYAPITF